MRILKTALAAYLVLGLAAVILVISGVYNVAATSPHWPLTMWVMENARIQSIKEHAAGIQEPIGLYDPAKVAMGTSHFAAHCAVCHGAPGVPRNDIAEGMYPQPPDLALSAKLYNSAQLFWILKHGIKMTGMPNWSDHGDDELWATVAFVKQLPGMTAQQNGQLVMESMKMGGRHNHGGMEEMNMDMHGVEPAQDAKPVSAGTTPQSEADPHAH